MKKDGKYRFSLQFPAETDEQIRVGDFLERMGNKKSTIVVTAVMEFLQSHPELECSDTVINLQLNSSVSKKTIELMIHDYIQKHLPHIQSQNVVTRVNETSDDMDLTVSEMLGNLEIFF